MVIKTNRRKHYLVREKGIVLQKRYMEVAGELCGICWSAEFAVKGLCGPGSGGLLCPEGMGVRQVRVSVSNGTISSPL